MNTNDSQRQERDRIVMAACEERRFSPARLAHYSKMYDADPEGTRRLLTAAEDQGGLAKGLRPVGQPAHAAGSGLSSADDALVAASRAQMRGSLREAHAIMAAAPASLSTDDTPSIPDGMGPATVAPPAASSSAPAVAGPSGVSVDGYGGLSFEGLPVTVEDGAVRVQTSVGALSLPSLRVLGLDLDQERLLHASRARMGLVQ